MTIALPTLYDQAVRGEPFERIVPSPTLDTGPTFWTIGEWHLVLPDPDVLPAPGMQQMARQIRDWTGWSTRKLADVLGTSHTTVQAIENGRRLVDGHSGDLSRRLTDAHDAIERTWLLVDRDPQRVALVLDDDSWGHTPVEELRRGDPASAHLAVVDTLRPRRPGLIVGDRPRRGDATSALHE